MLVVVDLRIMLVEGERDFKFWKVSSPSNQCTSPHMVECMQAHEKSGEKRVQRMQIGAHFHRRSRSSFGAESRGWAWETRCLRAGTDV